MAGTNKPQRNERAVPPGYACYRIISDFHNTYWIDRAYVSSQRIYVSVGSRGEGRGGIRINRIASAVPAWNPIFVKKEGVARAAEGGLDSILGRLDSSGEERSLSAVGMRQGAIVFEARELRFANCILISSRLYPSVLAPVYCVDRNRWYPPPPPHLLVINVPRMSCLPRGIRDLLSIIDFENSVIDWILLFIEWVFSAGIIGTNQKIQAISYMKEIFLLVFYWERERETERWFFFSFLREWGRR